jgi:hypothetical protein
MAKTLSGKSELVFLKKSYVTHSLKLADKANTRKIHYGDLRADHPTHG